MVLGGRFQLERRHQAPAKSGLQRDGAAVSTDCTRGQRRTASAGAGGAMVYISGFALDEGESIGGLLGQGQPTPALTHLRIDEQGFAWLPHDDFVHHFAADVDPIEANVMYAVQQPLPLAAYDDVMGTPAWKNDIPTWFAVAQNDEVIPPDAERLFAKGIGATTTELVSGHVGMVSHPDEVGGLIQTAAQSVA
jgi:pimeloyl-ACP methyl ester carboxylesterase